MIHLHNIYAGCHKNLNIHLNLSIVTLRRTVYYREGDWEVPLQGDFVNQRNWRLQIVILALRFHRNVLCIIFKLGISYEEKIIIVLAKLVVRKLKKDVSKLKHFVFYKIFCTKLKKDIWGKHVGIKDLPKTNKTVEMFCFLKDFQYKVLYLSLQL